MPRAVGRAARTLISFAPLETQEIRITYRQAILPLATYAFTDVPLLQRYFNGMASRAQLAPSVSIGYAGPEDGSEQADLTETLAAFQEPMPEGLVLMRDTVDVVALEGQNILGGYVRLRPGLSTYLNDPSGAFKYELSAFAGYDRALGNQTFLYGETRLTVLENVTDVTQPSNSLLPHVRTDIADYRRGGKLKLTRLLVNKFYQPGERVYARASIGAYEEMYSGVGGQVLYLPTAGNWAVDASVDALRQRDFRGWLGHRDYSTVTAIASLNYRMAHGVTATLRAGRFLAKDAGMRAEVKRRFASGFELGAWFTVTNGRDTTFPGLPSAPYHDKGIFLTMPLDPLLTRDTQAIAGIALSPWTRDVGQMVASPADLYGILERPVVQMHERDGLVRFGDREDDYDLPKLGADRRWPEFAADDVFGVRHAAAGIDWPETAALGLALAGGSAALDRLGFRFAKQHRNASWMTQGVRAGNALPIGALGLSAVFAFDESRARLSDTGITALEAGAAVLVATEGVKRAVGRARPTAELGNKEFKPGSSADKFQSFPSRHTALMWAVMTPYAEEYDLKWLYGVAALTNAARTGSRQHWFSDTVGGAALGYMAGHLAWQARSETRRRSRPEIHIGVGSVALKWQLE
jgi:membrane-associated phospholipid phosphatase